MGILAHFGFFLMALDFVSLDNRDGIGYNSKHGRFGVRQHGCCTANLKEQTGNVYENK
jgi:hypothetical protein